jgi:hypothetical protein
VAVPAAVYSTWENGNHNIPISRDGIAILPHSVHTSTFYRYVTTISASREMASPYCLIRCTHLPVTGM